MQPIRDCEGLSRRGFLTIGAVSALGLSLADVLRLEAAPNSSGQRFQYTTRARARNVILLWLSGGPSTIDMWDLKPEAPDTIRGEFRPIDTSARGIQVCEHMPRLARVVDRCTIIRSLSHGINDHGAATVYMNLGNRQQAGLQFPSLGSLAARVLPPTPGVPPFVRFSGGAQASAGYLGSAYNPFVVDEGLLRGTPARTPTGSTVRVPGVTLPPGFTVEQLDQRNELRNVFDQSFRRLDESADIVEGLDRFNQQAVDILRANRTRQALDVSQETQAVRERYGNDRLGMAGLAARRLIEAGARFVTLGSGGWDTHGQNFRALRTNLLPPLDRVLGTLIEDLDERGLLASTIVYCAGEFNRTPRINRGAGRDHWGRSQAVLLAGGGFRRGFVHGATDANGMAPATAPCLPDDVSATIFHCLGFEPNFELPASIGRPVHLFPNGRALAPVMV